MILAVALAVLALAIMLRWLSDRTRTCVTVKPRAAGLESTRKRLDAVIEITNPRTWL